MHTKGACCVCVYILSAWLLAACLVGSMSAGACLHVLWARYLRVGLDTVRALSATARCCLLRQVYLINFCSLSTFPQVIAIGMAASGVGDAPDYLPGQLHSWKDAMKALGHSRKDALKTLTYQAHSEGCIE